MADFPLQEQVAQLRQERDTLQVKLLAAGSKRKQPEVADDADPAPAKPVVPWTDRRLPRACKKAKL